MKVLVALTCLLSVCLGHMCLLNPYQRGPIVDVNTYGNSECGYTTGPCGSIRPDERVKQILLQNEPWQFILQKNLNHYNGAAPGNFTVALFDAQGTRKVLGSVPDTNSTNGAIYVVNANIPATVDFDGRFSVQAIYFTNNPKLQNAAFYQCADVFITA